MHVHARFRRPRRLAVLAVLPVLALPLAACGRLSDPTSADSEGVYVRAGAVTYQVQLSRQLNPSDSEDAGYLRGVKAPAPKPDEEWFVIFLWAKNETHTNQTTTDSFSIVDTEGTQYHPVAVDPAVNQFAWTAQTLRPLGTEPAPGSAAYYGPTQGGELLFKLNDSVYSNRPLTLNIYAPGQKNPSTVSLDL